MGWGSVIGGVLGSVIPGVGTAIGSAVGGLGESLLSGNSPNSNGLLSSLQAREQADLQNKLNEMQVERQLNADKELASYKFDQDLEMWNLQNEYNSPEKQMQRFKQAGLNPALMYGQGSAGNATEAPKYQSVQSGRAEQVAWQQIQMQNLAQYQDMDLKNAQIDTQRAIAQKEKALADKYESDTGVNEFQKNWLTANTNNLNLRSDQGRTLFPYVLKHQKLQNEYLTGDIDLFKYKRDLMFSQTEVNRSQHDLNYGGLMPYYQNRNLLATEDIMAKRYIYNYELPLLIKIRKAGLKEMKIRNKISDATYKSEISKINSQARILGVSETIHKEQFRLLDKYGSPYEQIWPNALQYLLKTGMDIGKIYATFGIGAFQNSGGMSISSPPIYNDYNF